MDAHIDQVVAARTSSDSTPVMDYEGSGYRTDFWVGQSRQYEDTVERLALKALLPAQGNRIAEIGAGFGRLADLYLGYRQIVLFDYSRTLLQEAVEQWGHDSRFIFVAGNVYDLPLADGVLDSLVMVRVMHHLVDVPRALSQLRRVLHAESVGVVEYANKRNLKALARWVLGRQSWSPVDQEPIEFVKLNFDFHPAWMRQRLEQAHFRVERQWAVSHFRLSLFKQLLSAETLAQLDSKLFDVGGKLPLAPSVFVQLRAAIDAANNDAPEWVTSAQFPRNDATTSADRSTDVSVSDVVVSDVDDLTTLFTCSRCFVPHSFIRPEPDRLVCGACDATVRRNDGIWDFKNLE